MAMTPNRNWQRVANADGRLNAVHTSPAGEKLPHLIEVNRAARSTAKLRRLDGTMPEATKSNAMFL